MPQTEHRRRFLAIGVTLACLAGAGAVAGRVVTAEETEHSARASSAADTSWLGRPASAAEVGSRLAALERRRGARVGVMAIDTGTGERIAYRSDERFALASTVKVLLAGTVLDRLSTAQVEQRIFWSEADLVPYSPVTEIFVDDGMTVRQLLDAALTMSDNTATNLLFDLVGGPRAVDDWLEQMGDTITSVDRVEPDLNDWRPGDTRDTSTPSALADVMRDLTLGGALTGADRWLLNDELGDSLTGARLVRAGVPASWRVGDKSGSASYGTRNDVAVVHPPGRDPWVVVVLTSHDSADADTDDGLVAQATRILVDHWS